MAQILPSKEQGQLLDVIDSLRSQGIDRHVPLPQLVVCGDQSSGKSSVLEAVSGIRFPTKETLCTRFATELILRRAPSEKMAITIRPSQDRSNEEKRRLTDFKAPTDNLEEFPILIEAAKEAMGLNSEVKAFSEDILRIEVSGPHQSHLTLVDLPGLFHSSNKLQSDEDGKLVKTLVRSYMASERSIILAVVSCQNDIVNQVVTGFAREVDPQGARTLGIITKPDLLVKRPESERSFRDLAKNEDIFFRLGWHVLRNRDSETQNNSSEERDRCELEFFSHGIWTSLPAHILGIGALKPRLSIILKEQIISVLPSLIDDIKLGIDDCKSRLHRLGEARETALEQRMYLVHVGQNFTALIRAAIDGVYTSDFFGDAMTAEGYSKRLRAVVQNLLLQFAEEMDRKGQRRVIIDDDSVQEVNITDRKISRTAFINDVLELMIRSRGCELPGTFNPLIVGDLFYQQSKPWKKLVEKYCERITSAIRTSLEKTAAAAADGTTCQALLHEILNPALNRYSKALQEKVVEIMRPHQYGHPITYNHYFTETIQKARNEREKKRQARALNIFLKEPPDAGPRYIRTSTAFNTKELLDALNNSNEVDMDRQACSEAVDCMEAYYKVAMKVLVDNFSALAIENCVIGDLANCLSPETVMKLDDALIIKIAAETEDSRVERRRTTEKLQTLDKGMETLNRFNRHKPTDTNEGELENGILEAESIGEPPSDDENDLPLPPTAAKPFSKVEILDVSAKDEGPMRESEAVDINKWASLNPKMPPERKRHSKGSMFE